MRSDDETIDHKTTRLAPIGHKLKHSSGHQMKEESIESNEWQRSGQILPQILPLNSAVIERIRLNMGSNAVKVEPSDGHHSPTDGTDGSVATVLQNSMKQKLADVLHSEADSHDPEVGQSAVIDVSLLWKKWSTLDEDYQKLIQTKSRHLRKGNTICLDSHLWTQFDEHMRQIRLMFDEFNQNKSTDAKRSSPQQQLIPNKRLKH